LTNENTNKSAKNISDIKFSNIEYLSCGDGFNMIYEREDILPFDKWTENEVYNWFKEMNLDEYLNIIKYKKITGMNILQADEKYFLDNFGMEDDIILKIQYEVNKMKTNSSCKNMKLWGWGNNKNGQMGQMNYEKDYLKSLRKINLPELKEENDFIVLVKIIKNYSILLTKFGEVYITGNYSMKNKHQESLISNNNNNENENNNNNNRKNQGNKDKKNKRKDSNVSNKDLNIKCNHKWVNITKRVCFDVLKENQCDDLRQ